MRRVMYLHPMGEIALSRWKDMGGGNFKRIGGMTIITDEVFSCVAEMLLRLKKGQDVFPARDFGNIGTLVFLTHEEMHKLGFRKGEGSGDE